LKRAIQREIENPLARRLIAGEIRGGQKVYVDSSGDALTFSTEGVSEPEPVSA
jgi:ATP-dependent Clp protease ATP-binding subunit ClpA